MNDNFQNQEFFDLTSDFKNDWIRPRSDSRKKDKTSKKVVRRMSTLNLTHVPTRVEDLNENKYIIFGDAFDKNALARL